MSDKKRVRDFAEKMIIAASTGNTIDPKADARKYESDFRSIVRTVLYISEIVIDELDRGLGKNE